MYNTKLKTHDHGLKISAITVRIVPCDLVDTPQASISGGGGRGVTGWSMEGDGDLLMVSSRQDVGRPFTGVASREPQERCQPTQKHLDLYN